MHDGDRPQARSDRVGLPEAIGLAAIAVGAIVLLGWALGIPTLSSIVPGTLTMKANTAVAVICLGSALVLTGRPDRRLVRLGIVLAAAAGLLAGATGLQYVVGADFGIDQALFREPPGTLGTTTPGRMAPQTAISLVSLAVALPIARRGVPAVVISLAVVPILLGAMNLIAAALGASKPPLFARYTDMALPTASMCVALGVGVIAALPGGGPFALLRGPSASASLARRLIAAALVFPFIIGWLRLQGERAGLYGAEFGVGIFILSAMILFVVTTWLATRRLAAAEAALVRTASELTDLYEGAPAGYHSLDGEGRIVRINETELGWLGYRREEVIGRPLADFLTTEGRQQFERTFPILREQGRVTNLEYDLVRRDGTTMPVLLTATVMRDANGRFVMSRSTLVDVTFRREADEAREAARTAAEAANRAKSEFLGRMSHELRTPLNAVLGFSQLLELGQLDEQEREYTQYIGRAGRHLLGLINEVMDISGIETGRMTLSPEPVDLASLSDEVLGLIRPMADARSIAVAPRGADLEVNVVADRQRLRQVLLNLLSNAVKYNREAGSIALTCSIEGERARIAVRDTGHGIPPDQVGRLFVPFERLGAAATGVEGTGIGLALSRVIVEAMNGRIGVESALDAGSTFWVELPVAAATDQAAERPALPVIQPSAGAAGRRVRILHVDDNPSEAKLVERALQRRPDVEVIVATQGRMALDIATADPPDAVVLDLHLPDVGGIEVLRELRRHPATRNVPVIVVSADFADGVEKRVVAEGAQQFLAKPFDVRMFVAAVDDAMQGGSVATDEGAEGRSWPLGESARPRSVPGDRRV